MSSISAHVLSKFKSVANTVKQDFKRKGIAIPVKNPDGSINLENYKIVRDQDGFYVIKNRSGESILSGINLPQSAALLANDLALGRWADAHVYQLDREYGYKLFETELLRKHASISVKKNNFDRADYLFIKLKIAKLKVEDTKKEIISSFAKLRNLH
jgi:hypothetical protein